ncbi:MAG: 4Fe-4S dicluster domain-containing protein, partial [Candidatus Zixiibacteriota bacterium]
ERFGIPEAAAALLLVEFDDSIDEKAEELRRVARKFNLAGPIEGASESDKIAELWKARKAIVPTLYRLHKTKRPISLIEDISLPPEQIPLFIEYITSLFASYNLTFGMFGHIGDGNLHIRPLFDLNDPDDFKIARRIYDEVYDKVMSIGGSITAEHAVGRLRAQVLRKLYGDEIFAIFREIKKCLDPQNILSPDSVVSEVSFTEKIDYDKIKSYCAACGKCNGYCPAYDIFRREDFSPRGWLRMLNQSNETRKSLSKYLSFCLNCRNCADVCPAGVDIASEIINFRSEKPALLSKPAVKFTDQETLMGLVLKLGKIGEPLLGGKIGRSMTAFFGRWPFGFDRSVVFPRIASRSLRSRHRARIARSGKIALFHGCADNLLESNVGDSVFKVFDRLGEKVYIPDQKCCGLPQEVYGHKDNLIEKARFNIDRLNYFDVIISGCASCLLKLKEYKSLFDDNDPYKLAAEELAAKASDICQYLNILGFDSSVFNSNHPMKITYHNPCHLRVAGLHMEPLKLLQRLDNIIVKHPIYADRCCAQAGSYGFTHFQESKRMFQKKKDEYKKIDADYILTSCPACQMKIRAEMGGNFKIMHPVELLAELLGNSRPD